MWLISGEPRCRLYQENCGVAYIRRSEVSLILGELRCRLYQENGGVAYIRRTEV